MNFSENKSFCVLPWMHIAVDPNGDVKPCCISSTNVNKQDTKPYNLGYDTVSEIFSSPAYDKIRTDMLRGNPVAGCERCYEVEKTSTSYRNQYNAKWLELVKKKIEQNKVDTVEYFDLRFGNLCNLKCKSCSAENSSQYEKELHQLKGIEKFIPIKPVLNMNDWYNTEIFLQNILSQKDNIQEIYITGGEPTIIEKNYQMLEDLIKSGDANNILIKLNTNMTNIQDRFLDIISQFKQVIFFASIDGVGRIQEYIRYPSNWNQIDSNFRKLINRKPNNVILSVTPVIQNINLGYCVELFEYLEQFNRDSDKTVVNIAPIILYSPDQLSIDYLPLDYKIRCWDNIEDWIKTCKYQSSWFYNKMAELKNRCQTEVEYDHNMSRFREFTDIFDTHRNFYLRDVNPELYKIVYK